MEARDRPSSVALYSVLTAAMAYGTITYFVIAALSPFIIDDLGITRAQLGLLPTIVYGAGALLSPWGGRLCDRHGGRVLLATLFTATALGLAFLSLATSYLVVVIAVSITSIATAITNPGTNQLIAQHVAPGRRARITGAKQSGIQLGGLIIGTTLPIVAVTFGWRSASGLVAVSAVVLIVVTFRSIPAVERAPRPAPAPRAPIPDGGPSEPIIRWVSTYGFLMSFSVASVGIYIPLYVVDGLARSAVVGGFALSTLSLVGVISKYVTGLRMREGRHPGAAMVLSSLLALAGIALLLAAPRLGLGALWIGVVLIGVSTSVWQVVALVTVLAEIPLERAGHASGTMQMAFYGGFACSPALVGALVDLTGTYATAWYVIGGAFAAASVVSFAWFVRRRWVVVRT